MQIIWKSLSVMIIDKFWLLEIKSSSFTLWGQENYRFAFSRTILMCEVKHPCKVFRPEEYIWNYAFVHGQWKLQYYGQNYHLVSKIQYWMLLIKLFCFRFLKYKSKISLASLVGFRGCLPLLELWFSSF